MSALGVQYAIHLRLHLLQVLRHRAEPEVLLGEFELHLFLGRIHGPRYVIQAVAVGIIHGQIRAAIEVTAERGDRRGIAAAQEPVERGQGM